VDGLGQSRGSREFGSYRAMEILFARELVHWSKDFRMEDCKIGICIAAVLRPKSERTGSKWKKMGRNKSADTKDGEN